jgi:hypothetical protein
MGLLDELKKEAESLRNQEAQRSQLLKASAVQVDQALRSAFKYLHELFRHLNVVKPACERSYNLLTVGKIDGLTQGDYRIDYRTSRRNATEYFEELTVTFRRSKPNTFTIKREAEGIERFRDLLWQNNMRFTSEPVRNDRRVITHEFFTINNEVICGADIVGDYEAGVIRFKLKNVEDFGPTVYTLEPSVIDDKSLEELAKLFIGQTETNFETYNRKMAFGSGRASYPKIGSKEVQYQPDPTLVEDEEAKKKRSLFGLFKK